MDKNVTRIEKPIMRSKIRSQAGMLYYSLLRKLLWLRMNHIFAKETLEPLSYTHFKHKTILLRKLNNVDMQYQYNKIINLKIAVKKINGIVIHPGQVFSYWKLIGKPTKGKGYVSGMVLRNGTFFMVLAAAYVNCQI